jgi:hypothetical protein
MENQGSTDRSDNCLLDQLSSSSDGGGVAPYSRSCAVRFMALSEAWEELVYALLWSKA